MRRTPLPRYIAILTTDRSLALDRPPAQVCALNLILMQRGLVQEISGEGVNVFWRHSVLRRVASLSFPFSCEVWGVTFVVVWELRYSQLRLQTGLENTRTRLLRPAPPSLLIPFRCNRISTSFWHAVNQTFQPNLPSHLPR